MLMTVEYLRRYVETTESDEMLTERLTALESAIRQETHNTFTERHFCLSTAIASGELQQSSRHLHEGDTLLLQQMRYGNGLYQLGADNTVSPIPDDAPYVEVYKVVYPPDIVMGCVDIMRYKLTSKTQDKAGVSSESISRHSVSYAGEDAYSAVFGVPLRLVKFLDRYRKARF